MHRSFTILEWPLLNPAGVPEPPPVQVESKPEAELVVPPRVAVPIEEASQDPMYAMLFPRVKRPTERTRS